MTQPSARKEKLPFIKGFISQTLSQNLTVISGQPIKIDIAELSFVNFQTEAESIKSGRFLYVYSETDRAVISVLLPEAAQKKYRKLQNPDSGETDNAGLTNLLNRIVGNLPSLCSVSENETEKNVFTIQKAYSSELKDQLLWEASECNIFRCTAMGGVFYLSLNIEFQKTIEKLYQTDPDILKGIKEKAVSKKVSGEGFSFLQETDIKVRVKNPFEFIIGSSFLPREAYLGKKDVSVIFNGILAAGQPSSRINKGMIWYKFCLTLNEKEYSIYYSVDVKSRDEKYLQFFNRLFAEMVKRTALFLRAQFGFKQMRGKIVSSPDTEDINKAIILAADINWENRKIKSLLLVPDMFVLKALSSLLEDWEIESIPNNQISVLLTLLSVNSTLFGKNINSFYRHNKSKSANVESLSIGVSKVLSILDTNNACRLVQNYFLAGGSSLDEFQSLFRYRYYQSEETVKIGQDALFKKDEYKEFIPKALHSDWDLCSGTSESYEEMVALNEKALKGIYSAMQDDKLLMPYKVSYILHNELQKPLDERFKGKIERLVEESQYQSLLEVIPKKTGQQAISAIPTSKLGTALVAGQPTIKELSHLMSKAKNKELGEELRMNIKQYELGTLSAEKVFLAYKELIDILEELAIPDEEMI